MQKYVIFINKEASKVIQKELITRSIIREMKQQGFRKYHVEVAAESETEAIAKVNEHNKDYFHALKDFTGDILIGVICFMITALVYYFRS